jgi:putative FmdB family regulatory protein
MPLYEYQCDACNHRFERILKFSDPPVAICPACGGSVRKLISSPAIQFKGTGFYITDYPKKSSTDGGKSSEGGRSEGGKSEGGKSEGGRSSDSGKSSDSASSKSTSDSSSSSSSTSSSGTSGGSGGSSDK